MSVLIVRIVQWKGGDNALIKVFPAFRIRLPLRKHFPDLALGAHDDDRYRRMAEAVPT